MMVMDVRHHHASTAARDATIGGAEEAPETLSLTVARLYAATADRVPGWNAQGEGGGLGLRSNMPSGHPLSNHVPII